MLLSMSVKITIFENSIPWLGGIRGFSAHLLCCYTFLFSIEKYTASETEITWKQLPKPMTEYTSSQEKEVVFLCRDQADIIIIKDVFGDELITASFSGPPDGATEFLLSIHSVRSCIIAVDARTIEEEVHGKSFRKPYEDLLGKARGVVGKNINTNFISDSS